MNKQLYKWGKKKDTDERCDQILYQRTVSIEKRKA